MELVIISSTLPIRLHIVVPRHRDTFITRCIVVKTKGGSLFALLHQEQIHFALLLERQAVSVNLCRAVSPRVTKSTKIPWLQRYLFQTFLLI